MSMFNRTRVDIIRAWKDEGYRMSLSPAQRAALPPNPAGSIELDDVFLDDVSAGRAPITVGSGSACNTGGGDACARA